MPLRIFTWLATRRSEEERRVSDLAATATPPPRAPEEVDRARKEKKARLLAGILEVSRRGGGRRL